MFYLMSYIDLLSIDSLSLLISIIAGSISLSSIFYSRSIQKENRSIIAVIQLNKDFYQDNKFIQDRLSLWRKFNYLKENKSNCTFIFRETLNSLGKEGNHKSQKYFDDNEIVALNRTASFYHQINELIVDNKIDIEKLERFFNFNYTYYWEPIRKQFELDGIASKFDIDQKMANNLFVCIPELSIKLSSDEKKTFRKLLNKKFLSKKVLNSDENSKMVQLLKKL